MGASAQSPLRLTISLRKLRFATGLFALALIGAAGLTLRGTLANPRAAETAALQRENRELRRLFAKIDHDLAKSRFASLNAEMTFAQLWAKSGLGNVATGLGMGPIEISAQLGDTEPTRSTPGSSLAPAPLTKLADLRAMSRELEGMRHTAGSLQASLGDMLEYFRDAEQLLSSTPSLIPVPGAHITSLFGRRKDPIFHHLVMHKGLDLGARVGTNIIAPADGVVIFTGPRGNYGQTIVIDHGYGIQTHYAHLSAIHVKRGVHVQRGDLIANVGSTGKSTGPHLHYEVRRLGQPLDPTRFILD